MKTIETLVPDIEALFGGIDFNSKSIVDFTEKLANTFQKRFEGYGTDRKRQLYLSNVGKPLRQLWYEIASGLPGETLPSHKKLSFLYGDVLEDLLLLLAVEAGHSVTDLQKEVEVDGVRGRIDCIVDGVLVDVKSASSRSFDKFKNGGIFEDDPFGYVAQLAGYSHALGGCRAGWLVVDKTLGHVQFVELPQEVIRAYDIRGRITKVRDSLSRSTPPDEYCYDPIPDGKSGNLKLPVGCSYCSYKHACYPNLRTFIYSNGPVFLTNVVREPNVFEVKQKGDPQ